MTVVSEQSYPPLGSRGSLIGEAIFLLYAIATLAVVGCEFFLLVMAWSEFTPVMAAANIAYAIVAGVSLIFLIHVRHRKQVAKRGVALATLLNLAVVFLPPLLLLELPNG